MISRRATWQDEVIARIERDVLSEDGDPDEIDDFGFHYPVDYIRLVVSILKHSKFVMWPDPGGFSDQDAFLVEDVLMYMAIENRIRWELKKDAGGVFANEPDAAIHAMFDKE